MTTSAINNLSVPFVLNRDSNGLFKINIDETQRRTKWMIANHTNRFFRQITVRLNLEDDLLYDKGKKRDLKNLIENVYFSDVSANADVHDLEDATTVGDLVSRIFNKYIPEMHRAN